MFTGIIQDMGTIVAIQRNAETATLNIRTGLVLADSKPGDSIAVDGICLTITALGTDYFKAVVMPETIRRTTLADLKIGSRVNLELALAANGRIAGHFVQGHIDTSCRLRTRTSDQNAVVLRFALPPEYRANIVEKGSVALNGVSLTISAIDQQSFSVSLIPHTLEHTVLGTLAVNQRVNLETDILGKYILAQQGGARHV